MSTNSPKEVGLDFRSNGESGYEGKSARSRRSKACKQCHALKVRCIPVDENDPNSSCVRCINAKKVCEIDTLEPKKRRKKIVPKPEKDSIAELKNQILALQSEVFYLRLNPASDLTDSHSNLDNNSNNKTAQGSLQSPLNTALDTSSPPFMTKTDLENELGFLGGSDLSLRDISEEIKKYSDLRDDTLRNVNPIDVVSLGIIDLNLANARLEDYRRILYPSHSYVKIPDDVTVEDLIRTQPFLLNSLMAATTVVRRNDTDFLLCLALEKHAISSITTEVLVNGSKSVELVKCLILLTVWYNIPEFFKARRYHVLNQISVTLLYDLGIVNRSSFTYSSETKTIKKAEGQFDDVEYRVMILTLFCTTVGFCIILRRAIFVKWTTYVEECCVILEKSLDERLKNVAKFLRLTRELDKVHHVVHSPECFVTIPRISTYTMNEFNTRLSAIRNTLKKDNHILLAYYYSVEAYLYQPLSEDLRVRSVGLNCTEELTTRTLNTISQCTSSCLKSMEAFNQLTEEQIACLPLFHFTRIIYTAGILMRLRYFILSLPSNIEKDLVPRYAIVAVLNLHHRINMISAAYPTNFLMKKMKLVLRLFIQTYVTQIRELLARNDDGTPVKAPVQLLDNVNKDVNKLAFSLLSAQGNQLGPNYSHGLHLDLLSYAATEHRKSNGLVSDEKHQDKNSSEQPNMSLNIPNPVPASNTRITDSATPGYRVSLPPLQDSRYTTGENIYNPYIPEPGSQHQNGSFQLAPYPPQTSVNVRPVNDHTTPGPGQDFDAAAVRDLSKDMYEFDDEFWSNLLTTDADKYLFAQDVPNASENMVYNIFN